MFHTEPLGDCQFQTLKRTSSAKFQQPETPPPDSLIVPHGNKQNDRFQRLWDPSVPCSANTEVILATTYGVLDTVANTLQIISVNNCTSSVCYYQYPHLAIKKIETQS